MDDFELEDLEDQKGRAPPVQTFASWRPKIGKRLVQRVGLLASWLRITVLPRYGWRVLLSMILITGGRLADAASFVVAIHILTRSMSNSPMAATAVQSGLAWAAAGLAGVLAVGSILGYLGNRIAVKLVLDYEATSIIEGMAIVRNHQESGHELPKSVVVNITRQAPRLMSRSLLNIISACTAAVVTVTGLVACTTIFPVLTAIVLLSLLLMSPIYIFAAVHSTNIGHRIRLSVPSFGAMIRRLHKRWLAEGHSFDKGEVRQELEGEPEYKAYREAFFGRLTLPARNSLLSNLTVAFVVAVSFVWIANEVELTTSSITAVVSYLVALRLFAHGLAGIFQGVQSINTLLPHYLLFLTHDPRLVRSPSTNRA